MAIFSISSPGVYVEVGRHGAAGGGGASGGGNGACGSGFGANGAGGAGGSCGSGDMGGHAHCISAPGHTHGFGGGGGDLCNTDQADNLAEFMRAMTQAIAQSMSMPPMQLEPAPTYLACENAFVVRDIDQRFSWQNE